ncbi:nicotinamidase [Komagataeibacter rhaeticus]|uniref:isochorismatase family protein n=1 Tax=Komagataeibacter rhaeticus TaxID=215221 RepID=UPI0004D38FBD|nr:isochorismatase family protein [Komagataeibacter rhaeticus]KDU94553.1 isochorismatase [Komagataeibacter rhaeticus AF1]MBL7238661.1 isochorismatase family protein [Komagataeibacter rhaeticus]PYD53685.1 nicotinamidase [Komagataeibacter rhaeticus]GBQ11212.1 nicotinamidase [Komagataeibacter rhaeticus DSM 16663]
MAITRTDALLIIDMQVDFLPGGALAVPGADALVPLINRLGRLPFGAVVASQDWHPADHVSFATRGGPWPVHCVAGSRGADLAPGLEQDTIGVLLRKGLDPAIDSYSAFADNAGQHRTGLAALLKERGITRVFVAGVALDYCVTHTARDARQAGFDTMVLHDACRAVAQAPHAILAALDAEGIGHVASTELLAQRTA